MSKKNGAQRAAKKHAKEKKRQKKLAERHAGPLDPLDRWRPEAHGIEGLARLLKTDSHHAAMLADLLAGEGKAGAAATWHPARVRALGTEGIVAGLAARGVATDAARFATLAAAYESSRLLAAERWGPLLAPDATVHDRDFVGQAAEVLWAEWAPERLSDEALADLAALVYEEEPGGVSVENLLHVWHRIRDVGGLARYERAVGAADAFVESSLDALEFYDDADVAPRFDTDAVATMLVELRAATPPGTPIWTGLTLRYARLLVDAGRPHDAIEDLLGCAAAHPALPVLPMEAVELYGALPDDPPGLYARIAAAVEASRDAGPAKFRDLCGTLLAYLREVRAKRAEPAEG